MLTRVLYFPLIKFIFDFLFLKYPDIFNPLNRVTFFFAPEVNKLQISYAKGENQNLEKLENHNTYQNLQFVFFSILVTLILVFFGHRFLTENWFILLHLCNSIVLLYYFYNAVQIRLKPIAPINFVNIFSLIFAVSFVFISKYFIDIFGLNKTS